MIRLDDQAIDQINEVIRGFDVELADALTALAKSFDYDQILVLLQSVGVVERECVDDLLVNASTCASVISHENAFFNSVASDFRVN